MNSNKPMSGRVKAVAAGAAILAIAGAGAGGAVAAGKVTTFQIKDGTVQTRDLTKNNFARFTATENVANATTAANPTFANAPVVAIPAGNTAVPLVQVVLDRGTYKIAGTAQFSHLNGGSDVTTLDYGQVTVSGLQNGFSTFFTPDIPANGNNAAQTSFAGTVTITADKTPVVVYGTISGSTAGQAGATIQATQYKYVKTFNHGS